MWWAVRWCAIFTVLTGATSCPRPAAADADTLLPVTFQSFAGDFRRALVQAAVTDTLTAVNCLDGAADKRKVCMYKLGGYMVITLESQKGGTDVIGITMICNAPNLGDSGKCLLSYGAAMALMSPDINLGTRGKIIKILLDGLNVGNIATISTDERKFILQKSVGLWFHILAVDSDDD
jgi:hypothetical protein